MMHATWPCAHMSDTAGGCKTKHPSQPADPRAHPSTNTSSPFKLNRPVVTYKSARW